ncbi:MAG TPA: amidohydrolase family protein [Vicinamibacterales bacterium]|nr:amidohydrolase family protein [Vicinamibacterales bacterium]
MRNRREFITTATGAAVGMLAGGSGLLDARAALRQVGAKPGKRREVTISGRRVKTVDLHAHCFVPEVMDVVKDTPLAQAAKGTLGLATIALGNPQRLIDMDAQGIDYQAINVNAWGYNADKALARDVVALQNERISQYCAKYPDRFVGMATLALQHPELAAEQLDHAVKKLGMRGAAIGGSVEGMELSDRKFDPFWAKAQELGIVLFMHPQPAAGTTQNSRLQGKGLLGNTIGNPLETTVFLSHLIFEGTLDRFPGLKICAAHAGGYLASYSGRSDALCGRAGGNGDDCRALKKKPSEYFRRELLVDTMIFHEDGLRHLVAEAGVSQIVYGTDYPFDWPVGVDFVLNAKFLSNADKEAILGGNAMKLLKIT